MAQYFVPIERGNLPACDPHRWLILPVEAPNATAARIEACNTAEAIIRRPFRATIWAAVRDIPSFEHMQELRECYDASMGRNRVRKAEMRVAGYA